LVFGRPDLPKLGTRLLFQAWLGRRWRYRRRREASWLAQRERLTNPDGLERRRHQRDQPSANNQDQRANHDPSHRQVSRLVASRQGGRVNALLAR
jgi:hypothetical protein